MKVGNILFCSVEGAMLFVVLSCPITYRATNALTARLWPTCTLHGASMRPTVFGIILHGILFTALAYGLMKAKYGADFSI